MGHENTHQGACLCGAVRISARARGHQVGACHCAMCRKWGGGPLFAVECEPDAMFEGVEHMATFRSSEWAERGFCKTCGTHLYYRLLQAGHYAIPVGLFDDCERWRLAEQIFIDQKPSFYSFRQKTKDLTGQQVFDQYSGS